jgi:ferredoxin-NADP reductase
MQATLEKIEQLADGITTFWFKPEGRFRYEAGEFTEMYIPHIADERGEKRWFTLSSSPTEPLLGVTTSFSEALSSSFKQALQRLQPGDNVQLAEPMGDFVLPKDEDIPLVFIAGGLGITPVRSIIQSLIDTGQKRSAQLLHIAKPAKVRLFEDIFARYPLEARHIDQRYSSDTLQTC